MGRAMGALLAGASLPVRDWPDPDERDEAEWRLRLEFALVTLLGIVALASMICSLVWAVAAQAHPGRTAADGCHNDRRNGGRHCHGAGAPARPAAGGGRSIGETVGYANCAAARAAGAAPVRRGSPGYARHLDRDGDGIGCE